MRREWWIPCVLLLLGSMGYMAMSRLTFAAPVAMPTSNSPTETNDCVFSPADFTAMGEVRFTPGQAWWTSFLRKQEYFSALSMGFVVAFVGFALGKIRQIGSGVASSMVAGGGFLAVMTLCLGCLAPTLATIGLGLLTNLGLTQLLPKWLMTVNTVILTTWGMVFLARRARRCPLPADQSVAASITPSVHTDLAKAGQA